MPNSVPKLFLMLTIALVVAGCAGSRMERFLSQESEPIEVRMSSTVPPETTTPTAFPILTTTPPSGTPPIVTLTPYVTPTSDDSPLLSAGLHGPLASSGPWLLGVGTDTGIYALNTDGTGLNWIEIPSSVDPQMDLLHGVARSNGLIALRTRLPGLNVGNYAIYLFRLPDTNPILIVPLLQGSALLGPEIFQAIQAVGIEDGHATYLWSPDERYLAFVAALDDVSSDVYVLDTETMDIQRLTDGPNEAVLMGWSPDSRWVVHMEAEFNAPPEMPRFQPTAVWAADRTGGPARFLYFTRADADRGTGSHTEHLVGWRNDREFVAVERDALGRRAFLATVDLDTGGRNAVYKGELEGAAVDPGSGVLAFLPLIVGINDEPSDPEDPLGGIQLLKPGGSVPERLDHEPWTDSYGSIRWNPELGLFSATRIGTILFTPSGAVVGSYDEPEPPIPSPDSRWLAFELKGPTPGVAIYDLQGNQIYEIADTWVGSIVWDRDSTGFYLLPGRLNELHDLFFFPISSGEVIRVSGSLDFVDNSLMLQYP